MASPDRVETSVYASCQKNFCSWHGAILVPEISLTPQMTNRFGRRFGNKVAVLHSIDAAPGAGIMGSHPLWRCHVGCRCPISYFAPVDNRIYCYRRGTGTYLSKRNKPDIMRVPLLDYAAEYNILVLGSATPAVETYYRTTVGKSTLLQLADRPGSAILPQTQIVDFAELAAGSPSVSVGPSEAMQQAF